MRELDRMALVFGALALAAVALAVAVGALWASGAFDGSAGRPAPVQVRSHGPVYV